MGKPCREATSLASLVKINDTGDNKQNTAEKRLSAVFCVVPRTADQAVFRLIVMLSI